jgi:hypothetical protein
MDNLEMEMHMAEHIAEVGYSKDMKRIEVVVPHGTKNADLSKVMAVLFSKDIIGRLPRGCTACTSGDHLLIRERLDNVIRVDLTTKAVVAGP